jgi:pSer/pThr/pTyr-binding forkhead associated (FHA) protein
MLGRLTFLSDIYKGKVILFKSTIIIGRETGSEVTLAFPSVSRKHAKITRDGDQFFIQDLKSRNGTFVNGHIITDKVPLNAGDTLHIGLFDIRLDTVSDEQIDKNGVKQLFLDYAANPKGTVTCLADNHDANFKSLFRKLQ